MATIDLPPDGIDEDPAVALARRLYENIPEGETPGWTALPNWILLDQRLAAKEILVLLALTRHANKSGWVFPSKELLAKEARVSTSSVQRALNELAALGLITRKWRLAEDGRHFKSSFVRTHMEAPVPEEDRVPGGWINGEPPKLTKPTKG